MSSSPVNSLPLNSFQDIPGQWQDVLSESPVNTIFLTPQWQEVWWESFGNGSSLAGFYLTGPQGVAAVAPLARSGHTLSFVGNQDTVDYNDFMVRPGYETSLFDALLRCMDEQGCDTLELASLTQSSPTLEHLPEIARQRGFSVDIEEEDVTFGIVLPDTWDAYLEALSKKDRHELRRKFRRLEALPDWRWYRLTDAGEVAAKLDKFIELMRLSKPDKDEFMTPERERFFYAITERMAQAGMLRLFFLEMEGQTVATSLCFDYASSRLLYNSGYDPGFSYYSVGLLLDALCLRDAIEQRLGYFDFMRGSEPYKAHLGGKQQVLHQMVVKRI
jgi:CelD/BcsL family acetyltransferase involved in cellulose biosynthesis